MTEHEAQQHLSAAKKFAQTVIQFLADKTGPSTAAAALGIAAGVVLANVELEDDKGVEAFLDGWFTAVKSTYTATREALRQSGKH